MTAALLAATLPALAPGTAARAQSDSLLVRYEFDGGVEGGCTAPIADGTAIPDRSGNNRDALAENPDGDKLSYGTSAPNLDGCSILFAVDDADNSSTIDQVRDADAGDYLNGLDEFTVTMWIRANAVPNDLGFVSGSLDGRGGGEHPFDVRYDAEVYQQNVPEAIKGGIGPVDGETGNHSIFYTDDGSNQTTDWQHVAWVYDAEGAGDHTIYLDGAETALGRNDDPNLSTVDITELIVGRGYLSTRGSNQTDWEGNIDDFRVYDASLSQQEIMTVMDGDAIPVEFAGAPVPTVDGQDVTLAWRTLTETDNAGFRVQHKREGASGWTTANRGALVPSKAGNGGHSNVELGYEFEVTDLTAGRYRFRVQQKDRDGDLAAGPATKLIEVGAEAGFALEAPAPNPLRSGQTARLSFSAPESEDVSAALYNSLGQEVRTLDTTGGTVEVEPHGLSSGVYFVRIESGERTATQQITLVR
ncbi:MAG: hypothetical protein BRD37_04515 [Bacteroidetes bacterium QH_8_67_23]|nr:MAG: hypothetical protein BRD37_04515 [Bacteroidetes bacterium QH_8_67_23]